MSKHITVTYKIPAPPEGFIHGTKPSEGDRYCVLNLDLDVWENVTQSRGSGHHFPSWRYATKKLDNTEKIMDAVEKEVRRCLPFFKGWVAVDENGSVFAFECCPSSMEDAWQAEDGETYILDYQLGFNIKPIYPGFDWKKAIREVE